MEPWQSWVLFLALSGAVYLYYSNSKKTTLRPVRRQSVAEEATPRPARKREQPKPKRKPESTASGSDAAARLEKSAEPKSANKKKDQRAPAKAAAPVATYDADNDDNDADREWARQLAELKKGTSLAAPQRKDSGRGKTVKQRAANADRAFTSGSDDADAEGSPFQSGRDVSDMLEAPGAGPSVLRLTESTNPVPAKKQQKKAAPEPQESKKQRQNRKKVEQAKAERDEAEKARKVLMENQRRGAREARGEPAKNGLSAGAAPASNAWSENEGGKVNGSGALLDTFEHDGGSKASGSKASGSKASGSNWEHDLPSEEEQLRLVMEDSTWSTVETKGKKSKKKTSPAEPEVEQFAVKTPEVKLQPLTEPTNTSRSNTTSSDFEPTNGVGASADISSHLQDQVGSHPQDSDWAVV